MALRRSKGIPPLEVMGRRGADHVAPARSVPDATSDSLSRGPDDYPAASSDLWSRAQLPMVLRVPRGVLAILIVGAVGLLVLAYLVGYSRGEAAAVAALQVEPGPLGPGNVTLRQPPHGGDHGALDASGDPAPQQVVVPRVDLQANPLGIDTRESGLNYHYLALYDRDTAERLIQFLQTNGVESCAVSVQNGRLFQVIDLQGVAADRIGDLGRQRKDRLTQLGRLWKQQNNGPSDLSDAYLRKYSGR
jgi:hypothetical protein